MKKYILCLILSISFTASIAQLSGTYTIGGTTPDYATFTDAVNALTPLGVSGPVTFNVRDGIYTEKVIIPVITGTSATNKITFQSESGDSSMVILTQASSTAAIDNFTLQINGADYVTFSKMTISRTGSSTYGTVVSIGNNSTVCRFLNNIISGSTATSLTTNSILFNSAAGTTSNDSATTISDCVLENGSYGIYLFGPSATVTEAATVISNNKFRNIYGRAIHLGNQNAPVLSGNEITTNSPYATFYCMYFASCRNNMVIDRNKMSAPASGYGIYFTGTNGTGVAPITVTNNFIHVGGTGTAYGIYITASSFIYFWHNSINVASTGATSRCFFATGANTTKLISQNNVFVNSGGGQTYYIATSALISLSISNFNDLYSTGPNLAFWDTGMLPDLASWQAASSRDGSSVSADPLFASATDLHTFGGSINNLGTPIATVTTDIDGEARSSTTPDIGADEFVPLADNVVLSEISYPPVGEVCGNPATTIGIIVENIGSVPQSNIPVQVDVTGAATISLYDTLPGPLAPNTFAQVLFSQTINTTAGGQFTITAFSSLSNDQYRDNDTLSITRNFYALPNAPTAASPQQACDNNAQLTATADSGYVLFWYDQATGGNLLYTGEPFSPLLTSDTSFYVEAREGGGNSGCLRITECEIGTNDFVEVQNLSGGAFDATGWIVAVSDNYSNINAVNVNLWQLGSFTAGEIKNRGDVTGPDYWGSNILWNPGNTGWAILIDPTGTVRDFVVFGWTASDIQSMSTTIGGFPITIGQEWTGDGVVSCATGAVSRMGSSDSNSSVDFACETGTMGFQNVNLAPSFANCGLGICGSVRTQVDVTVIPGVSVNLGNDTTLATPISYTLDAGPGFTSYLWSDNSTAQTLSINQPGLYWVTVTASNGCFFTDTIAINMGVGIETLSGNRQIHLFPNPANESVKLIFPSGSRQLLIADISGRIVFEKQIDDWATTMEIAVNSFHPGVYFLRIPGEHGSYLARLVISGR